MDLSRKRKTEDNGTTTATSPPITAALTLEDANKILSPLNHDNLKSVLSAAMLRHADVLDSVRSFTDADSSLRKIFIRGLSLHTTSDTLRSLFSIYGPLDEAIVIADKLTGKSKGYGFITFKHVDSAILALKESSKKIDGRITVSQLAAAGINNNGGAAAGDVSVRKIYVANVPADLSADRLLSHFLMYGEIEEGPLGFDKATGKSRGFAFFVYKNEEGAKASLVDSIKSIDGHQVVCKLAVDYRKMGQNQTGVNGNGVQQQPQMSVQSSVPGSSLPVSQYGPPAGGFSSYRGFSGGQQRPPALQGGNYGLNSSYSSMSGAYGPGYGGLGGGFGGRPSMYLLPPSSVGMPSAGYPDGGHYGSSLSMIPGQREQSGALPRVPPGGMYPPYY